MRQLQPQCQVYSANTPKSLLTVEMRCQMLSSLLLQSEMFSQYKSHTTLKGTIGVSPHGAATFVSSLYFDSTSDRELFRQSGIVLLLDKDMAVMVDKGFRIDDLVLCKVYRPPFLSKKSQLSHNEVLVTQDIAHLHVERTILCIRSLSGLIANCPPQDIFL